MDQPPTPASVETDDPWPEFSDGELESYQKSIENPTTSPDGQLTLGNYRQTHTELSTEDAETATAEEKAVKPCLSPELEFQFTWGFYECSPKAPKQPKSLPDPTEFPTLKGKKQTHSVRFAEDSDIVSNKARKPKPRDPFNDDSTWTLSHPIDELQEKFQKEPPSDTTGAMSLVLQNLKLLNHEAKCARFLHESHKSGKRSLSSDIDMVLARVRILEAESDGRHRLLSNLESRLSALEIKVMRLESMAAENQKEDEAENETLRKAWFGGKSQIKTEIED